MPLFGGSTTGSSSGPRESFGSPPTRNSWRTRYNSRSMRMRGNSESTPEDSENQAESSPRSGLVKAVIFPERLVNVFRRNISDATAGDEMDDYEDRTTVGFLDRDEEILYSPDNSDDEGTGLLSDDELKRKMRRLERQVEANKDALRQFKNQVSKSRESRKKQIRKIGRRIAILEDEPVLPQDTYSFFAITRVEVPVDPVLQLEGVDKVKESCGCPDLSFTIAVFVLLLQLVTLTFLAVDVIDPKSAGNPLGIPAGVEWTVQVCQLIALFITVISQDEVRVSLNVLFDGYKGQAFDDQKCVTSSRLKWNVSAILRLGAGVYSLALTFMLIISSSEVRDLLLNFTAVEFISNVDDTMFLLCTWGYFGEQALADAEVIASAKSIYTLKAEQHPEGTEVVVNHAEDGPREADASNSTLDITDDTEAPLAPKKHRYDQTRCRCSRRALILAAMWVIMLGFWIWISVNQGEGDFLPQAIYVQFGDERVASVDLGTFSGLYRLDASGRRIFGGRKKYVATNGEAKFQYCYTGTFRKKWTFSFGGNAAEDVDPCKEEFVRAQSAESIAFDLTTPPFDTWYYRSNSSVSELVELNHFSIGKGTTKDKCGTFGDWSDVDAKCICHDGWYGIDCRFGSCQSVRTSMGSFNDTNRRWSVRYEIYRQNGTAVQVYNRPVFVGDTIQGDTDVMFFTGSRWVLTHTGRLPKGLATLDGESFHGHWSNYTVAFISQPVVESTELKDSNKAAVPIGLSWFYYDKESTDSIAAMNERTNAMFFCACASDSATLNNFTCENDGVCLPNGKCECVGWWIGERCEISGEGNGKCDQHFNTEGMMFDTGDCCNSTCTGKEYQCGTVDEGDYVGFPLCRDPSQLGNGICDMSLNTEGDNMLDGGDCCEHTCNHTNCGTISESVFGGPYDVGFPYCRLESVPKWANLTIVLELGLHPENIGFRFTCNGQVYGDSSPGALIGFRRRVSTLVVPDGATCDLLVRGNETDGRFKVYYGPTTTNEDFLVDDRNLAADKSFSFIASQPFMVPITVKANRTSSTHQVTLGLLCTSLLQSHNETKEVDFNDEGKALETVLVRHGSWCQFDEEGKDEYHLYFGGETGDPFFHGEHRDGQRTKVFFQAVAQADVVQVVALVKIGYQSDHATVGLKCLGASETDAIQYSDEITSELLGTDTDSLRHVYIVPKHSHCVFTVEDSAGRSGGSLQLLFQEADEVGTLLEETEISHPHESVYFHASRPDNIITTSLLYEVHNGPDKVGFDLHCSVSFPRDTVAKEMRSILRIPNNTKCSFTMSEIPGTSSVSTCTRGAGYYRVFDGMDPSTDKLLARGYQIEGENNIAFTTGSLAPVLAFPIAVQVNDNSSTGLAVQCDNALKIDEPTISTNETHGLFVREGASCELTFSNLNTNSSEYHVTFGQDEETGRNVMFSGGGVNGSSKVFFAALQRNPLVPVTLVLDDEVGSELGHSGGVGVRLSCDNDPPTYFRFIRAIHGASYTFMVPEGSKCKLLIVDVGTARCCDKDPRVYSVYTGTNATAAKSNLIMDGNLTCRDNSTLPPTSGEMQGRNLFGRMASIFLRGGID